MVNPCISNLPSLTTDSEMQDNSGLHPVCRNSCNGKEVLAPSWLTWMRHYYGEIPGKSNEKGLSNCSSTSRTEQLMQAQETDPELTCLFLNLLDAAEANKVATCFYKSQRILMRKWRHPTAPSDEEWQISHQIVVSQCFLHNDVLNLAYTL